MPLRLFRSATFSGVNALTLLLYGALGGAMFLLPFALISVHGYSATLAGAVFLPFTAIMAVLSRWSGGLLDRFGARLPLVAGPAVVAVGFVLFALAGPDTSYALAFLLPVSIIGLGMAVTVAPLTTTVIAAVPGHQTGVASGINNAVSSVASLFAIAAFGALALHGSLADGIRLGHAGGGGSRRGRGRLRVGDHSWPGSWRRPQDGRRRTSSMKPRVAAERSSPRQARLSGTLIAGRPGERPVGYAFQRQAAQRRRHDGDAEPGRHEVEGRDDARRLLADMRAEARLGAGRDDHVVEAAPVGPAVEDEGLVGEILEREMRPAGQRDGAPGKAAAMSSCSSAMDREALRIDQAGADEGDVQPLRRAGRSPGRPSCSPPARRRRRAASCGTRGWRAPPADGTAPRW